MSRSMVSLSKCSYSMLVRSKYSHSKYSQSKYSLLLLWPPAYRSAAILTMAACVSLHSYTYYGRLRIAPQLYLLWPPAYRSTA